MTSKTGPAAGGRGGRRPGAGAPRGNRNALRHGRYGTDPDLSLALAGLTAEQRRELLPYLRATSATIKRRQAWIAPRQEAAHPKIVPIRPLPSATTTTHAEQSNQGPLRELAFRLASHGFVGADGFVRAHSPAAQVIEAISDHLDSLDDDTYKRIKNPGGLIRAAVHEEIADRDNGALRCPWCPWRSQEKGERTS